ncbi:Ig-like domain repeat protein [Methanobrevibacter sp. TMH8]|uniref:right-handed parallel beta-helix repeat-containing protein n=1 Tax=Methanobrevibacter sp. TMH8 TaxID=2848611 RepID=UPI001CCB1128|nr:Ig-like domain repeat protein [Methanobrevibacter sp. TMH8]MBZ9571177.1 Ig-like domain repeat protein [Methanobrevibacter sp. TMH8]
MTFINCIFDNNNATYGGGISSIGTLIIKNSTFINNTAVQYGPGIYAYTITRDFNISDSIFMDNNGGRGGGIFIIIDKSIHNIINCTFINNSATVIGGAIQIMAYGDSNVDIINCTILNNFAGNGGGMFFRQSSAGNIIFNINVINCSLNNNSANGNGGGIVISPEIFNSTVNLNVINCSLNNNSANMGGGIHITCSGINVNNTVNVNISNSFILNNTANNNGGGIDISLNSNSGGTGTVTIANCTVMGNSAGYAGDGIYISDHDHGNLYVTIVDSDILENVGDGIHNEDANLNISGSNVSNNTGNGITTGSESNSTITYNEIVGNSGHGVSNNGTSTIEGNTINDNDGHGIANSGNVTLNDNTIVDNNGVGVSNDGNLSGLGNTVDYRTNLTIINTIVLYNRVNISVKAIDDMGNVIVGATINFYVNGKLVGSAITNNEGIAQFTYTASSSGLQNIIASMPEFNSKNTLISTMIHLAANNTTSVKVVLENGTVITVSAPTINEGKKTNIKATLKDVNGNILKNKKVSLTIKGKTYIATTNNNGIAVFNIAGLKGGKHTLTAKFTGDSNYKSSKISKVQKVNPKTNLGILSIKKLSFRKKVSTYRVTIANKGSLKSKSTVLALFHMRNGVKIKTKYIKIKSIAPGKKISIIVSYFPDKANHRYCIAHFQVDPKNKNKEVILANNKKSISLKH